MIYVETCCDCKYHIGDYCQMYEYRVDDDTESPCLLEVEMNLCVECNNAPVRRVGARLCGECSQLSVSLMEYFRDQGINGINLHNFAEFKRKREAKQMREEGFTHHPVIREGTGREPFALMIEYDMAKNG